MDSKKCTKCGEVKSLDGFNKRSASLDGLQHKCRQCSNAIDRVLVANASEGRLERRREAGRKYREKNRESINKRWSKTHRENAAHRAKRSANTRRRQAAKMQRTVSWANDQLIAAYYKEAKRLEELTGIKFHVDHIIPLQGELVSGLHVETNLQLLPAHENLVKKNSFDPELFCA